MMKTRLKTKRLTLAPAGDEQMRAMIDAETDPETKQAYREMRQGAEEHPDQRQWYIAWPIALRDGTAIGDLCFKGPPTNHEVEIGYGLAPRWWGQGYATEAVKAATAWAFMQEDVIYVTAETLRDNIASQRVLAKVGFTPNGEGKEGPRFAKEKPPTLWMLIYMMLGMGVGAAFGGSTGNMALAEAVGICIGLALGAALDAQEKEQRRKIREQRAAAAKDASGDNKAET